MLVSAHLPLYLPRLAYFDLMAKADTFIVLDDVPFDARDAHHRSRLSGDPGDVSLTVPVLPGDAGDLVLDKRIDHAHAWQRRTWHALAAYRRAPHFLRYLDDLRFVYTQPWRRLVDLDLYVIDLARRWFDIRTPLVRSSTLELPDGEPTDRLIAACKKLGARTFLAGDDRVRGIDLVRLERAGIGVVAQRFEHPVYRQHGRADFSPDLAFLDMLFNCGASSRELLIPSPMRAALAG